MRHAFKPVGDAIGQFNDLSHFLHLDSTEGLGIALTYDSILHRRIEQFARDRAGNIDFFRYHSEEQIDIKRAVISDAITQAASKKGPKGKGKKEDPKGRTDKSRKVEGDRCRWKNSGYTDPPVQRPILYGAASAPNPYSRY